MNKIFLTLLLLGTVIFSNCNGDEPIVDEPKTKTNTQLLTEGEWQMVEGTIVPSIEIDIFGNITTISNYWDLLGAVNAGVIADCDKDNRMICQTDSNVVMDEGPSKCDAGDPQATDGGKWNFENNEKQLRFSSFPLDPTGEPRTLDVTLLTATSLKLSMSYLFVNPLDSSNSTHAINLEYANKK
ncbi:MAG: hypothetical protein ACI8ZN_001496 [Bacteroidia bacterium]|jgi:hypothetical protein